MANLMNYKLLPQYLWSHPSHYAGYSPDGHIIVYSRTRDSDASLLEESNWNVMLQTLEDIHGEADSMGYHSRPEEAAALYIWRAGCSMVGWVDYLTINPDKASDELLRAADDMLSSLKDYPLLDDQDYCNLQDEAIRDHWNGVLIYDRVDWCRENGCSIFAARHEYPPPEVEQHLRDFIY